MVTDRELNAMMADGLLNTVRDAAKGLYGVNQIYPCDDVKRMSADITRLRTENERLARDYNTSRDAHDAVLLENERLRVVLESVLDSGLLVGPTVMHDKIRGQARAALALRQYQENEVCMGGDA